MHRCDGWPKLDAHCSIVSQPTFRWPTWLAEVHIPAYHDSSSVHGSANSERVYYDKDIMSSNGSMSYHDAAFNYMVVKLDQPLGDVVGYWNATVYDRAWNGQPHWAHIGYTDDIADGERPIVVTNNSAIDEVHSYFASNGVESYLISTSIDFENG